MLRVNSSESILGEELKMCVHYWVIDYSNKGICNLCGQEKDFSPSPEKLTKPEKKGVMHSFNHHFYKQGAICLNELDVL